MLSEAQVLDILKNKDKHYNDPTLERARGIYYRVSLHVDGVCPSYQYLRTPGLKWKKGNLETYYPSSWMHDEYDVIFRRELFVRFERTSEQTQNFCLARYKPFTKAPFGKICNIGQGAIFQDGNYSITLTREDDNNYIWDNHFAGHNLPNFFGNNLKQIGEAPEGYILYIPKQEHYATTTQKIEPDAWFIKPPDIYYCADNTLIFKKDGYMWIVDDVMYARYRPVKNGWENADQTGAYYVHNMGFMPAIVAGGLWNSQGYYDSWFDGARAFADEYVTAKADEQLVNAEASHPIKTMVAMDCPNCKRSNDGTLQYCPDCGKYDNACTCNKGYEHMEPRPCPTCLGAQILRVDPGDIIIAKQEDMEKDQYKILNPDMEVNKFHAEYTDGLFDKMLEALHIRWVNAEQSGEAKKMDNEPQYQFLFAISDDIFDRHIPFAIKCVTGLRNIRVSGGLNVPDFAEAEIVKPSQLQIKTAEVLLEEFKAASTSGMPGFVLSRHIEDYIDKQFGGDKVLIKKGKFIARYDRLSPFNQQTVSSKLSVQIITESAAKYSDIIPQLLEDVIDLKGEEWFANAPLKELKSLTDPMFTAYMAENPTQDEPQGINVRA